MVSNAVLRLVETPDAHRRAATLGEAKNTARQWTETLPESKRKSQAALFAWRCLKAYRDRAAPQARLSDTSSFSGKLDPAIHKLADDVGREASHLGFLRAIHAITSFYPALLRSEDRCAGRILYTAALADRLVALADEADLNWRIARVLDPSAGAGSLLLRCAIKMRAAIKEAEPALVLAQLGNRLQGFEIDSYAAALAQASLEILLADLATASGHSVPKMVRVCDTLSEIPEAKYDLVISNPPYGRVALTPEQE